MLKASIDLLENRLANHTVTYMDVPKPTLSDLFQTLLGIELTESQKADVDSFTEDEPAGDPYAAARAEQHPLDDDGECLNIMCRREMDEEWEENDARLGTERIVRTETVNAPEEADHGEPLDGSNSTGQDGIDTRCAHGCCLTDEGGEEHEEGEDLDTETEGPQVENPPDFGSITSVLEWLAKQPGVSVYRDREGQVGALTGDDSLSGSES